MRKIIALTAVSLMVAATVPAFASSDNASERGEHAIVASKDNASCSQQAGTSAKGRHDDGCLNEAQDMDTHGQGWDLEKHGIGDHDGGGES